MQQCHLQAQLQNDSDESLDGEDLVGKVNPYYDFVRRLDHGEKLDIIIPDEVEPVEDGNETCYTINKSDMSPSLETQNSIEIVKKLTSGMEKGRSSGSASSDVGWTEKEPATEIYDKFSDIDNKHTNTRKNKFTLVKRVMIANKKKLPEHELNLEQQIENLQETTVLKLFKEFLNRQDSKYKSLISYENILSK